LELEQLYVGSFHTCVLEALLQPVHKL